jgi:hypothetical protein
LKLILCKAGEWGLQQELMVFEGLWGNWERIGMCDENSYIIGGQVRFEGRQGGDDDTALNGLQIVCKNPVTQTSQIVLVSEGMWGDWKDGVVDDSQYVTGGQVRFEGRQGHDDDTAMNGI